MDAFFLVGSALAMGESKGFTAIGDVVNTAARLQESAREYEIVISEKSLLVRGQAATN